jgi:1-acyl-sn-glycerol-3-phosphate acyltransferase
MAVTTEPGTEVRALDLRLPRAVYGSLRTLAHLINRSYWRVSVEGPPVPATGGVILAPVHRSFIDFFVVSEATRRKLFYMTKEEMWNSRALGAFLDSVGAFPVRREGSDRLSLGRAQAVLERKEVLVLFPEGTRRSGDLITDLHGGTAFLAARAGAVIVPVGIGGTQESLAKGSKVPRPVKVHLVIGDPIGPPERAANKRTPRHELNELTEQLRSELQKVYDLARSRVHAAG